MIYQCFGNNISSFEVRPNLYSFPGLYFYRPELGRMLRGGGGGGGGGSKAKKIGPKLKSGTPKKFALDPPLTGVFGRKRMNIALNKKQLKRKKLNYGL